MPKKKNSWTQYIVVGFHTLANGVKTILYRKEGSHRRFYVLSPETMQKTYIDPPPPKCSNRSNRSNRTAKNAEL